MTDRESLRQFVLSSRRGRLLNLFGRRTHRIMDAVQDEMDEAGTLENDDATRRRISARMGEKKGAIPFWAISLIIKLVLLWVERRRKTLERAGVISLLRAETSHARVGGCYLSVEE